MNATTETLVLAADRSFTLVIDRLDCMDTGRALAGASALARQIREVVIPEVDWNVYNNLARGAGTKPAPLALTKENIYEQILLASKALDDAMVPETGRVLLVTPDTYRIMKLNPEIMMDTELAKKEGKSRKEAKGLRGNTRDSWPNTRKRAAGKTAPR